MTAAHVAHLMTAADLSHEPDDGRRRELHAGVVHVVPPASNTHGWEARIADRALSANAPDDILVFQNVGVHVGNRRLYVPDVMAVHADTEFHDNGYDHGGVVVAVEVVSPSSLTLDRITKPAVYAEMGIPYFWRIDHSKEGKPRLEVFVLDAGQRRYVQQDEFGPGDVGSMTDPWPIAVNMADFVLPGRR